MSLSVPSTAMPDIQEKLVQSFRAVFPDLSRQAILVARADATQGWDSTALVTLMTIIEEEFGIAIEAEDLENWTSFEAIRDYLAEHTR